MCSNKHICISVAEKLIRAKKMLSERLPVALKENNYNQPQLIIDEQVNRVFNQVFMMEE